MIEEPKKRIVWGDPLTDKGPQEGGSGPPEPRGPRSAFEVRGTPLPKKRRRLGEERVAAPANKTPRTCSACGGAHPSRMCGVGS